MGCASTAPKTCQPPEQIMAKWGRVVECRRELTADTHDLITRCLVIQPNNQVRFYTVFSPHCGDPR